MQPIVLTEDRLAERAETLAAVREMLDRVEAHDRVPALNEAFLRGLAEDSGHRHLVAYMPEGGTAGAVGSSVGDGGNAAGDADGGRRLSSGDVVGIMCLDLDNMAALAVAPEHRRSGVARALLAAVREELGGQQGVEIWAHGDLPAAQGLVASQKGDGRRTRELLKMALDCPPGSDRDTALRDGAAQGLQALQAAGYELLTYPEAAARAGADAVDAEWLRVNNEAFAWHPEQGGWDRDRLNTARAAQWYDPDGVFLLWATEDDCCVGYHWTKLDRAASGDGEAPDVDAPGEVYVICLADAARGRGLGGPLTLAGMVSLLDRGARRIELFVEGENRPAVATYEKLGFRTVQVDSVYRYCW